jgi:FdhE protein
MSRWNVRIERARELEARYPASSELLRFYRTVARFQSTLKGEVPVPPDADAEALEAYRTLVLAQAEAGAAPPEPQPGIPPNLCPRCGEKPVAAVLRPEGEGAKRSLLCGVCLQEWDFRRVLCPNCGEEDTAKLPVFGAQEFPQVRIEACDTCKCYLKAIDLTKDGHAVPEVDELAALALDLWAVEKGYHKLQQNLFGI